ncbi:MAG TPA: hypothetical protein VF219_21470 [Vicinamibacterales bacterium]
MISILRFGPAGTHTPTDQPGPGRWHNREYAEWMSDRNARIVYSTAKGRPCPTCGWPVDDCKCSSQSKRDAPLPTRIVAKLRTEKTGRGGKTVTVVYDLPQNQTFLKDLAGELKRACGAGGAVVENTVEIQGELRDRIHTLLTKKGWIVKG